MTTAIVLFTRDLRVHDHPPLHAAVRSARRVVPLFVLDPAVLEAAGGSPNRIAVLHASLVDLQAACTARGGRLLIRRGDTTEVVRGLAEEVGADELHLAADVSSFARRREGRLRSLAAGPLRGRLVVTAHQVHAIQEPGSITPSGGDHFKVFTPYWRRWVDTPRHEPLPAPARIPTPDGLGGDVVPALEELTDLSALAARLPAGGEEAARAALDAWLDDGIERYDEGRDRLGSDATSRLSHHLHLGTLSATTVADRLDRRRTGHEAFLRQLCWRDLNHQLLAARPELVDTDLRPRGDQWRHDPDALAAWQAGRTGYPLVDAGMRQLLVEGFMHNRARMVTASFLTKHLYLDWRLGAAHFLRHLVDGDLANNQAQWQWVAGTGMDPRPNRVFNPVLQSERYDPHGDYLRRYVPELAGMSAERIHAPWRAGGAPGYPPPLVDHAEARERFLSARGA